MRARLFPRARRAPSKKSMMPSIVIREQCRSAPNGIGRDFYKYVAGKKGFVIFTRFARLLANFDQLN
jgi:hypothetical protein